jgi:hypothetical protein
MYPEILPCFFLLAINRRGRFLHQHQALIKYQAFFRKIMQIFPKTFLGKISFIGNQKCYDYISKHLAFKTYPTTPQNQKNRFFCPFLWAVTRLLSKQTRFLGSHASVIFNPK